MCHDYPIFSRCQVVHAFSIGFLETNVAISISGRVGLQVEQMPADLLLGFLVLHHAVTVGISWTTDGLAFYTVYAKLMDLTGLEAAGFDADGHLVFPKFHGTFTLCAGSVERTERKGMTFTVVGYRRRGANGNQHHAVQQQVQFLWQGVLLPQLLTYLCNSYVRAVYSPTTNGNPEFSC